MTPTQTAERLLELPDEDSISSSDKYDYEYLCDAPDLKSLAREYLALREAAKEASELEYAEDCSCGCAARLREAL